MAQGLGFKNFVSGDVLTAADTNGYLMQGVWVFANAAARTAAVTSPQEGNVSYLRDTDSLEIYSGTAWVAYGSGDITGVTTAANSGLTGGATSGDVSLRLNTTAKGSIIAGTGTTTLGELTVGANNTVLTADSTTATGLKWAAISNNPPAFYARKTGPDQSFTTGTVTKVTFTTEDLDSDGWYNTSTSRFTPLTAGWYLITSSARWENTSTTTKLGYEIYKNGVSHRRVSQAGTTGTIWNNTSITCLIYFNGSTDYVEIYGYQDSGSNKVIFYGADDAWFHGQFVRS